MLTDTEPACRGAALYWLETTPPNTAIPHHGRPRPAGTAGPGATAATGSSCQVTVTFTGLRGIPATAVLVLDQAGTLATIPLTVSREVTLAWYLGIPVLAGAGMALAVLLASVLFVRISRRDGSRVSRFSREFWTRPLLASGAWTLNDSWATNITAILALIGTVLTTATAASSLFPGVALDRFALVNIAAGGVIVATPVVFGILYALFSGANRGPTADATIWLPGGGDDPAAHIAVPSGAGIVVPGVATVTWRDGTDSVRVQAGKTISVPPGGDIRVLPGASLAIPGTTAEIAVHAGATLSIGRMDGRPGELVIPEGDRVPPGPAAKPPARRRLMCRRSAAATANSAITCPAHITTPGGAKITVAGTANVTLPQDAEITAPQQKEIKLLAARELQVPQPGNAMVAGLWMVVAASVVTMFGAGAQIGIAGVLAFGLSGATSGWRWFMLMSVGLVATVMLCYAVTALRTLANPKPGSSISSAPGTSFTL